MTDDAQTLYAALAARLIASLPDGWARAQICAELDAGRVQVRASYISNKTSIALPGYSAAPELIQLRELMANSADSRWSRACLTVFTDGTYDCAFAYPEMA
jgi:hypothetical protein